MAERYDAAGLKRFGADLFAAAGMPQDRAATVSEMLVDADLMGHDTHGLNLAPQYLAALEGGEMPKTGDPEVISDRGPSVLWDGGYLSGVWLVRHAMDLAMDRARQYGLCGVSIRRSGHIACLASFLPVATAAGQMLLLLSSDPANAGVAPHGAVEPIYTPNPMGVGIPTDGDPVLIDISASITTMGLTGRAAANGERMPGKWLVDAEGRETDDPAAFGNGGALLPLGGIESGHKGFGLGIMIEAMTSGLGGFGRKDRPEQHGASVLVLLIDPEAFGGLGAFAAETGFFGAACRAARTAEGAPGVRLPGERALQRKRDGEQNGVALFDGIMPRLIEWAGRLGVEAPRAL
ncbi:MAG: Ldh family oxidoreductase [Minwuia sp.]|uniref:Ldh family oxidoreductase n=1 Tax=Minwuia sp. TaxID=2493630 RepID=UPI003A86BB25